MYVCACMLHACCVRVCVCVCVGDGPPIEADEKFENTRGTLLELLNRRAGVYQKEDHALRVIIEQEVKDKMERKKGVCVCLCVCVFVLTKFCCCIWRFGSDELISWVGGVGLVICISV